MDADTNAKVLDVAAGVAATILSASFSALAWIVNALGKRHLTRMDTIIEGQNNLHDKVDKLAYRVARLEGRWESVE